LAFLLLASFILADESDIFPSIVEHHRRKLVFFTLLVIIAFRGVVAWNTIRHSQASFISGATMTPIFTPSSFPPIADFDPNQFDIAPNGNFVFHANNELILAAPGRPATLSVLAARSELDHFAFDAGGSLLVVAGDKLGMCNSPLQQAVAVISKLTPPSFGRPHIQMAQVEDISPTQVPGSDISPPTPFNNHRYYDNSSNYSDTGHSRRSDLHVPAEKVTVGAAFSYLGSIVDGIFTSQPDDRVSENGTTPHGSGGSRRDTPRHSVQSARSIIDILSLPTRGMRIARGSQEGELLLFGGTDTSLNHNVYRIKKDGTAEWVLAAPAPIVLVAEANQQLYAVMTRQDGDYQFENVFHIPLDNPRVKDAEKIVDGAELANPHAIESIAVDPSGTILFVSTAHEIYEVNGPVVWKIADGIGGILRVKNKVLYILNAKRKLLLALSGVMKPSDGDISYEVARIHFRKDAVESHYALFVDSSESPSYEGNDIAELARKLNQSAPIVGGGMYYLTLEGFPPVRAENLITTLKMQQSYISPSVSFRAISKRGLWKGILLQSPIELNDTYGSLWIEPRANHAGWFTGMQDLFQHTVHGLQVIRLRVQARSRSIIEQFFRVLRTKLGMFPASRQPSVVEIVNTARAELKRALALDDADLRITVFDQTGRSFIVLLLDSTRAG
jgi:hypothetical protein